MSAKIIAYRLAEGEDADELETVVDELIREDWQPLGSASVSMYVREDSSEVHVYRFWFCQAMVKYERG